MARKKIPTVTAAEAKSSASVIQEPAGPWSWVIPSFLVAVTFVVFSPTLQNGFVNWDDPDNLLNNPHYRGLGWNQLSWMFTTFHMTLYRPITWVTHGADFLLWGMEPWGYHLTSLIFHLVNSLLVYFLTLRLLAWVLRTTGPSPFFLRIGAGVTGLLFALHPLRVEAVAWASGRENVVAGLFFLLTLLCYLKAVTPSDDQSAVYWKWMILAWLSYGFSLLSKVSGVTLPLLLLILDIYPLKRLDSRPTTWFQGQTRRVWLEKIPLLMFAGAAAISGVLAKDRFGTMAHLEDYGVLSRLNQTMYGLVFYLWKTVAPTDLSPLYEKLSYLTKTGVVDYQSSFLVILITACFYVARRRWPAGLAAWAIYSVVLLPVLGIVPFGPQIVADRYSYLACLGWSMLAGAGAFYLWQAWSGERMSRGIFMIANSAIVLLFVTLGALSWKQAPLSP